MTARAEIECGILRWVLIVVEIVTQPSTPSNLASNLKPAEGEKVKVRTPYSTYTHPPYMPMAPGGRVSVHA